jgi:hypothetical protein
VTRIDGEVLAQDNPWPYKTWPVSVGVNYLLPHMANGANSVELSRGYQDWMNNIASHLEMYSRMFADPSVMVEKGALAEDLEKKKAIIPNLAGKVWRLAKGGMNRVKVQEPQALPPTLFTILEMLRGWDQDLKGVHDIAQGRASKGDQTLGELNKLDRNTRQRVAMQGAMLDVWLKQCGNGIVEVMQRNYTIGDYVRYAGMDESTVKASISWTQAMQEAGVDVSMEPTSTLPFDEEREQARYLKAYELVGPAMLEDVLKKLKVQNVQDILQRHELLGPFQALMEMAAENGMGPDQVAQAISQQLAIMQDLTGAAGPPAPQQPTQQGSIVDMKDLVGDRQREAEPLGV